MAKEKKGLGVGQDVLFAAAGIEEEPGSELLILPISKVEPREEQPREYFDEQALQELSDSISQYGMIQPIVARRLDTGYYQIIAGERRWRASRMAGLSEIPVRVIEADDRRTAELALVENLLREDLNPIEEAKGYQALINDYGLTQEEAAKSLGRSRPVVTNALRLLTLSEGVRELVEHGMISAGHARALLPISDPSVQLSAANEVIRKSLSVRRTEQMASKLAKEEKNDTKTDSSEPLRIDYAAEVSDELTRILGHKTRLLENRRSGKIEIEFFGPDERESLIETLRKLAK